VSAVGPLAGALTKNVLADPKLDLVKDSFMAGEAYALSFDLVQYVAASPALRTMVHGKEDKLVARWLRMHPQREEIVWVAERCWIYDHPKAGTV
jgi:hypothetical protein